MKTIYGTGKYGSKLNNPYDCEDDAAEALIKKGFGTLEPAKEKAEKEPAKEKVTNMKEPAKKQK